jgi:hypothetical protein
VFECGDTAAGRRRFVERLDRRAVEEEAKRCGVPALGAEFDARCSHLRKGWYWGTQAFAERMTAVLARPVKSFKGRSYRSALERRSHDMTQAEEWIRKGIAAMGLAPEAVRRLPGSDPRKVALAKLLWEQTTVQQAWIADRLGMGSAANVSQQIRRGKRVKARKKLPPSLSTFINSVKI